MKFIALWVPVAAVMGLLFFASSRSVLSVDWRLSDKLLHVLAYLLLGSLVLRATHGGLTELRLAPTIAAFLLTVAYGASDELHQMYVPGRIASVVDFFADTLGAGLSILLMGFLGSQRSGRANAGP